MEKVQALPCEHAFLSDHGSLLRVTQAEKATTPARQTQLDSRSTDPMQALHEGISHVVRGEGPEWGTQWSETEKKIVLLIRK